MYNNLTRRRKWRQPLHAHLIPYRQQASLIFFIITIFYLEGTLSPLVLTSVFSLTDTFFLDSQEQPLRRLNCQGEDARKQVEGASTENTGPTSSV